MTYGDWTEQRVTRATAAGGQPDFTFAAHTIRRGSGQREIGDTIVWVGNKVLVISTKSRDLGVGQNDSEDRARAWLDRAINGACRQIDGVVRTLAAASAGDIELRSERGVTVPWDPNLVDEYSGLVIVNYTPPPDYVPIISCSTPSVAIQAREWELILGEIRTTTGLFEYLRQRHELDLDQPLGTEKEVLGLLGFSEYGDDVLVAGMGGVSIPPGTFDEFKRRYPESALGFDPEDRLGFVIDAIISRAHDIDPEQSETPGVHGYLTIIEVLDSIPRLSRTKVGKMVMDKVELARVQNRPRHFVAAALHGRGRVVFIAHPGNREQRQEHLKLLTTVFHAKYVSMSADPSTAVTVGVSTESQPNAGQSHDFMFCEGELWSQDADFVGQRDDLYSEYFPSDPA